MGRMHKAQSAWQRPASNMTGTVRRSGLETRASLAQSRVTFQESQIGPGSQSRPEDVGAISGKVYRGRTQEEKKAARKAVHARIDTIRDNCN